MENIRIEDIGTGMPYNTPSEDFFMELENDIISKVTILAESKRRKRINRLWLTLSTSAAVLVALFISLNTESNSINNPPSLEQEIDSYINQLSDEELDEICYELDFEDEFYNLLP